MCLAPKVRHFNKTTKAPVDLGRLKQMKQCLPSKAKPLEAKKSPSVGKKVEVASKPAPQDPFPRLAPRTNPQAALDAIFRDSFGASPSGDIILVPRLAGKELTERPESPFIRRTLSFCSVSSEISAPASNLKSAGSIYLYADCRYEEETKEDIEDDYSYDGDDLKLSSLAGLTTPPITHVASLSPPPSPRPRMQLEQEAVFPPNLWLPSFP